MKTIPRSNFAVIFACSLGIFLTSSAANNACAVQAEKAIGVEQGPEENTITKDDKIQFSFKNQDWEDVVPWFADQAGFSMQPVSEWPAGTFNLTDNSEYTPTEALDQLNHALRMRNPPYTLIRNRKMLILAKESEATFPNDLIETVEVEDLDKRGKYETISVIFDCGELNAEEMHDQLRPLVTSMNSDYFAVFPAANQIHVRGTGAQLQTMRDLIKSAEKRKIGSETKVTGLPVEASGC